MNRGPGTEWSLHYFSGVSGDMKHRRVKHYGYEFLYSINNIDPECPLEQPIPDVCQPFLESLVTEGHISAVPDQLTLNQYEPGQGRIDS